ncbi:MAG: AAA family ATPase [Luteitalea sp.]|nr:AAA family ATPase [Luteitalea sp.]
MYEQFYGLQRRPFDLTPDSRYLYLTPQHGEALAHLEYALTGRRGITVLVGEAGTGKTTLLGAALERVRGTDMKRALVSNPTLKREEFFELVAAELGLSAAAGQSKAQFLIALNRLVRAQAAAGGVTALIIDEAQSMSFELLEEIRLLANLESETEKLLQVILVGQPELADRLNAPELRQLKQRVALRCRLTPLGLRDTAAYIAGRIRIAGGEAARVFTRDAVSLIHARSHGIPRLINVLCDNALVTGFASGMRPIERQAVLDVCRDFDFAPSVPSVRQAAEAAIAVQPSAERDRATPNPESPATTAPAATRQQPSASGKRSSLFGSLLLGNR